MRLRWPEGARVTPPMAWLTPERLARQSAATTYLALVSEMWRQSEGVALDTLTLEALSARTGLTRKLLSRARRELAR